MCEKRANLWQAGAAIRPWAKRFPDLGQIAVAGEKFRLGSGGAGRGSIPYGDYPVTPNTIGPWRRAHGALGINNNAIYDPKLGATRGGIEFHAGMSDKLISQGCVAIAGPQWRQFSKKYWR